MKEDDLEDRIRDSIKIPETPSPVKSDNPLYKIVDELSHTKYRMGVTILLGSVAYELYKELQGQTNTIGALLHSAISFSSMPIDRLFDSDYYGFAKNKHPFYVVSTILFEAARVLGPSMIPVFLFGGLKEAVDYFRLRKSSTKAEKMMLSRKKRQSLITYTPASASNRLLAYKHIVQAAFYGQRNNQEVALKHTEKALELDPDSFMAIADHALALTRLHAEKGGYNQEMQKSCYKFWKRISSGDYTNPIKFSMAGYKAAVKWRENLDKRRGKDNLASQEKIGHNLGISVVSILLSDPEEALKSLDLAMDFESMLRKADVETSRFVQERIIDGKKRYILDKDAYEQHLVQLEVADKQLMLVGATAYDAIAKESKTFRGKAFERSQWAWGKVFQKTRTDRRSAAQPLGESKSRTYVFSGSGFIEDEVVFKENKSRKTLEEEVITTYEIAEAVKDNNYLLVPAPIGIYAHADSQTYIYIMRRNPGRPFNKHIESLAAKELSAEDFTYVLTQVIYYTATLHHRMTARQNTSSDPEARVRKHLEELQLEEKFIGNVVLGCKPVFQLYNASKKVFHKDAHPGNWNIEDYSICSLDNERTTPAPCQSDLVKLLELCPGIPEEIKEKALTKYCRLRLLRKKPMLLKYHNEIIYLTLRNAGSLVSWDRNSEIRQNLFNKSVQAVDRIKHDFSSYYRKFERE